MPGERPPMMTRDLQPCQIANSLGHPSQHSLEDHAPAIRTIQGMRESGSDDQTRELPEAQLKQGKKVEPKALLLRTQAQPSPLKKGSNPQTAPRRSHAQAHAWLAGRTDSSPPQLHGLSITSSRARPTLDEPPEGLQCEAPQVPEAEGPQGRGTRVPRRPSVSRTESLPSPKEIGSQRCFQEAPSSFTSTNCTSPSATPGLPPLRAPQSSSASPHRPASHSDLQTGRVNPWPPAAENSFPGANFGVSSAEPKPFPEGSSPGSPQRVSISYPFSADGTQHEQATGTVVFAFHQPLTAWSEAALGTSPTYPPLPCHPGQPGNLNTPSDLGGTLSPPGAAHSASSPFPNSLHKSLTKVLPEGPPPNHDGLGSPRGPPPNPPPQRHFPGQGYGANGVGTSPGPLDTELPTPTPQPTHLPQLWDPVAAPYPMPTLGPAPTARTVFFEGQGLCLPQSPPMSWPPVLTTPGPAPHQMRVLSRLPFPRGASEWQGVSQGVLGAINKVPGPGETLSALRNSPGQPGSSPGLLTYGELKDPVTQPLFFGGTQTQVSPRGPPGLPPPRVVGASPSESPLPSPATHTASSSTCSSLSPPSSSPANPSSEDSQQPGPLGSSAFFLPHTHSQETGSPFPSPEPPHALSTHYQPEPAKLFPLPTDGLAAEDTFESLEGAPFPGQNPMVGRGGLQGFSPEPSSYSTQHFSLSSASLDQLDVLLTCRQCDRNYSSLAAFLEHRQFCSLLLAKTKDGPPQPTTAPKEAADTQPDLLEHSQNTSFLLARDIQGDGKEDSLRTSFLPSLAATTPFPLPASDLDMEDDAKLDRLITEALNGMEYQSDTPEIDSSFIDVFVDEEPSGPRGPSTGQPSNTQLRTTPEKDTQALLPAGSAIPESRASLTGDRGCSTQSRPKTRSLGLASTETDVTRLTRQQRRGKQFKFFQKELDVANSTNGPTRAICLRPRRRGCSSERPRTRDRRTHAAKGHANADHRVPRATSAPTDTRSSKRLRIPSGKDGRKRRTRGGSWSKELIHKIVQQKNRRYRRQGPHSQVAQVHLLTPRPSNTQDSKVRGHGCASESEEDDGPKQQSPSFQSRSRHSHRRRHRGEKKKKEEVLTQGPRKVMRKGAGENRGSPTPGETHGLSKSLDAGEASTERAPGHSDHSTAVPITTTKTSEESHTTRGLPQEASKPEIAAEVRPDTTELREMSSSPVTCARESPRHSDPELLQPRPPRVSRNHPNVLSRGTLTPGSGHLLDASGFTDIPRFHNREEDPPASQLGECLAPIANTSEAAYPNPSILVFKNSDPSCDLNLCDRHPMGDPVTKRGSHPNSNSPCELFLGPKGLTSCFPESPCPKPLTVDPPPADGCYLGRDGVKTLEPTPPKNSHCEIELDPGKAHSPLTLESTSLFAGLSEDGFDPPLYDGLSANRGAHVPVACADSHSKKTLTDPLYPSFLMLEEDSPVLPGPFPDLSEGKTFSKKCPFEGTASPSPPSEPGKGSECSINFMSNLCEDELEIKRLVTELESQLQRRPSTQDAPGEPDKATCADRMGSGPEPASPLSAFQATSSHGDTLSAANLTGLGGSSPQQEGALRSPQGRWPCPTICHTREAVPPSGTREDSISGAPSSTLKDRLRLQTEQKADVSKTDDEVPLRGCLPDPNKQQEPLMDAGSLAKCNPNQGLLFPKNNETARAQNENEPLLPPCEYRQGHSPDSHEAQEPHPSSPALEAFGAPIAHLALAPNLALRGAHLDATSPPSGNSSHASEGHLEDQVRSSMGAGLTHPIAEGHDFEGDFAPVEVSLLPALQGSRTQPHLVASPSWVPSTLPEPTPQDPALPSFHSLQVLGVGAKGEGDTPGLPELHPVYAQSPQCRDTSALGGVSANRSFSGARKMSTVPAEARRQLGPEADGHLDSPGQAKKPRGQGQASQLQSDNWRSPVGSDTLAEISTHLQAKLARGREECEASRSALGLWEQAQPSSSPTQPDGKSSVPSLTRAMRPVERSPEKTASPHQSPQMLCSKGLSTPPATPTSCGLEPLSQEEPSSMPSTTKTRTELRGPPEPPSCKDPPSPQHRPASASALPGRAGYVQAPTDAGPRNGPAASPSLMISQCGPEETLPRHSVQQANSPKDAPSGLAGLICVSAHTRLGRDGPKGSTVRTLEDSRKEELKGSPSHATTLPDSPNSPRVNIKAAGPSDISTKDNPDSSQDLGISDLHCMGTPSSEPQNIISCPGHLTDPATLGPIEPDSHTCLEGEAGASSKEQGRLETPGVRRSDVTKVPRAGSQDPLTGLHLAQAAFESDSPQSHISLLRHSPQKDHLNPQDPKRRPQGFKKKSEPTDKAPAGPPVTCEICLASFRSRAGLSRHKARKHRLHREASSQPSPAAVLAHQPPEPMAQTCQTTGKKSRKAPRKEQPNHSPLGPTHTAEPPPIQGSTAPEHTLGSEMLKVARRESKGSGTPGAPHNQPLYTLGLMDQGKGVKIPASKPRRSGQPEADQQHPSQAETRGQRQDRQPADSCSSSERISNRKAGKPRVRRRAEPGLQDSTHMTSNRLHSDPSTAVGHHPTTLSPSPEGERATDVVWLSPSTTVVPRVLEDVADKGPRALCAEEMLAHKEPQDCKAQERINREQPVEQKAALAWWFSGPEEARALDIGREPSLATESQSEESKRRAEDRSDRGIEEGTPDPHGSPCSEVGSAVSSCIEGPLDNPETQGGVQKPEDTTPEALSPSLGDPQSLFDDEVSFSQLFPLDGRLARKKNPRVYGKRCKRPKRPPPVEPSSEVMGSDLPSSTRLPTDLSDSGSLCLSREEEDPWDDETIGLQESLLLDGLLSGKMPGLDPWAPSLSLWTLEPSKEASCAEETPCCCTKDQDEWSETIPQLHMVPAAWRGLELCTPTYEMSSSLGDRSPEPPNLEREHNDSGLPGNASLPPLHTKDFEVLSTQLEMQDLCLLEPCDDLAGLPSPSLLDFKATGTSQRPLSKRTEQTTRVGLAKGKTQPTKGRKASYKCRVCFQRFHGLGELDLHKLAHSPSPPPTCYMCVERRFSSRELLREHLWEKHVQGKAGPWACGMCLKEVADVWMYNQHLREHAARFARNRQARRALGDLPGCLEGDHPLTQFLNSIVEQVSKPQRGKRSTGKAGRSPKEASELEEEGRKETSKESTKPKVHTTSSSQDGALTSTVVLTSGSSSPSTLTSSSAICSIKTSPIPSPDPWSHSEPLLQAIPVHQDCKDPSRDCHHCGKRFPKPFKLQRHLAVHSPQRVYLCPRCPRVYPEHRELRVHLEEMHGVREERELPPTPLYTCELCANVMHAIRRSFVCSSCNYTFAKKEQFDRHKDKHLRSGQQPFTLRGVRRPGAPWQKAPALEGTLPIKRPRVTMPSSPAGLKVDEFSSSRSPAPSECSLAALPLLCSEVTTRPTQDQPSSQEKQVDPVNQVLRPDNPLSSDQDPLPLSLSTFPAVLAEGASDHKLDRSQEKPEDEALQGSPGLPKQQAPLGEKRTPHLFSGKCRSLGKCVPDNPSLPQKEKPVTMCHMVSKEGIGRPSQKGSATKYGAHQSSSKDISVAPMPSKTPKFSAQPRNPMGVGTLSSGDLAYSSEDREKLSTPKAKPKPNTQNSGGPLPSTQTGGGSQPQPASGQLQSETATIPAKSNCPSQQSPNPDQPPPRAHVRGSTRGSREAGDQRSQGPLGPREKRENSEKRRQGQASGLARCESAGNMGRAPSASDKPPRAPRKQATPSRIPPAKLSSQSGKSRPQPTVQRKGDPSHTPERSSLQQARPLSRPLKRYRAVRSAEPTEPRDHRTAEAQSDLLNQLFGQKLTSFKIPLKKDTSQ